MLIDNQGNFSEFPNQLNSLAFHAEELIDESMAADGSLAPSLEAAEKIDGMLKS